MTLAYKHNDDEVRHVGATPTVLAATNLAPVDRQCVSRLTVGSPKDKPPLSGDYTRGIWSGHADVTRYGKFTDWASWAAQSARWRWRRSSSSR